MKISGIFVYPIKSLGGIPLETALVERRGLQFDRRYLLVDEKNGFLTQREFPKMATIGVSLSETGLTATAAGFESLSIPFETDGADRVSVRIWKSVCDALVLGREINQWFGAVLETDCRLVFMPDDSERQINARFNQGDELVSFADGYPLLLIGEGSLEDLNGRLEEKLPMNRFRPNLVVEGSEPFAEDRWKNVRIGQTVFRLTKPCARCVITTIDQGLGETAGKEPLRTLSQYRMARDVFPDSLEDLDLEKTAVLFGENLVPENPGHFLKLGDQVEVLDSKA